MRAAETGAAEAALVEDADEIDDDVLAAESLAQLRFLIHIAVLQREPGQHQQVLVQLTVARQHGDLMAVLDQAGNQPRAQESGTPENDDGLEAHGQRTGSSRVSLPRRILSTNTTAPSTPSQNSFRSG